MLVLQKARQSIWSPYAQKPDTNNNLEGKNGNKRKKHETVLVVARLLVNDFYISRKDMASVCDITIQEVSAALKKIRSKLSDGHIIIGLNNKENDQLKQNLELRAAYKRSMEDALLKDVAKLIFKDYRLTGKEMANRLNESAMNISRALKKITERIEAQQQIAGLTMEQMKQLNDCLTKRDREQQLEKERRKQERELEKANREAMREYSRAMAADKKRIRKKPATISREGLAEWNRLHYDHKTGKYNEAAGAIPADLPRYYPKKKIALPLEKPSSPLMPAAPLKASGTRAGRKRIDYLRMF